MSILNEFNDLLNRIAPVGTSEHTHNEFTAIRTALEHFEERLRALEMRFEASQTQGGSSPGPVNPPKPQPVADPRDNIADELNAAEAAKNG